MLNKDFFLNKLRAGESIDDLGTTIAALMNDAIEAYEAEKALAAKANNARKSEIVVEITDLLKHKVYGYQDVDVIFAAYHRS